MDRRKFLQTSLAASVATAAVPSWLTSARSDRYDVELMVPCKLFDGKNCWAHPRGGIVSLKKGVPEISFVMAMLDLTGNDIFTSMYGFESRDLGKTFTEPRRIGALSLAPATIDGKQYQVGFGDIVPKHHAKTDSLLATGHTMAYTSDLKAASPYPKRTAYAVFDNKRNDWKPWRKMEIPDELNYTGTGAGCCQRIDLPDGKILLPVSYKKEKENSGVTVMRCSFDGEELKYETHGNEMRVDDTTRGIGEPSLALSRGQYFLTIRHNERGYVTTSRDGLNFASIKPWTFDDGSDLGSYNTQQHWVTHKDTLYLVYTRRGANNDHVFRNRAPLFMAEVDPAKLCVIRSTETIILPEKGARYGNFGICQVNANETWITESEWMQPKGVEKYGSDGKVYLAKVKWK